MEHVCWSDDSGTCAHCEGSEVGEAPSPAHPLNYCGTHETYYYVDECAACVWQKRWEADEVSTASCCWANQQIAEAANGLASAAKAYVDAIQSGDSAVFTRGKFNMLAAKLAVFQFCTEKLKGNEPDPED